jgi:hypothetical protein
LLASLVDPRGVEPRSGVTVPSAATSVPESLASLADVGATSFRRILHQRDLSSGTRHRSTTQLTWVRAAELADRVRLGRLEQLHRPSAPGVLRTNRCVELP